MRSRLATTAAFRIGAALSGSLCYRSCSSPFQPQSLRNYASASVVVRPKALPFDDDDVTETIARERRRRSLRNYGPAAAAVAAAEAQASYPFNDGDDDDPMVLKRRVLVYDGVCHLCHAGVKWIIKADRYQKIKFCCLQSKASEPYMKACGVSREDVLRRFLFIESPNKHHQGSDAALRVVSYLPLPYSALSSLMVIPAPRRDAVYDYVASRRYEWYGKGEDCLVLKEPELIHRFVDWKELIERSRRQQP